jgi:hypothetical protein
LRGPVALAETLAFGERQEVDEEPALEVIDLMLEADRKKAVGLDGEGMPVKVAGGDPDARGPFYPFAHVGNGEAAFFAHDAPLAFDDDGIDEHASDATFFRNINDKKALTRADLGGGKSDASLRVHGLEHVVGKAPELGAEARYLLGLEAQAGVGVKQNGANSHQETSLRVGAPLLHSHPALYSMGSVSFPRRARGSPMCTRQRSGAVPGRKERIHPSDSNYSKAWAEGGLCARSGRGAAGILAALVLVVCAGCASVPVRRPTPVNPRPVAQARHVAVPPPEPAGARARVPLAPSLLARSAPYRYVVRPGDTLWAISVRFLHDPWLWPDIWYENPFIRNPDLIYPGEVITLENGPSGRPVLTVRTRRGVLLETTSSRMARRVFRRRGTVVLRPHVEIRPLRRPVEEIPYRVLAPFLTHPVVLGHRRASRLPYVLRGITERPYLGDGDRAYVRGLTNPAVRRYSVVRIVRTLWTYNGDHRIGREVMYLGQARVLRYGDPAVVRITRSRSDIQAGDRLVPLSQLGLREHLQVRPPRRPVRGHIVAVFGNPPNIGTYQIVVIDRGRDDGLRAGNVLTVYNRSRRVDDPYAYGNLSTSVSLPGLRIGDALIFHADPRMSLALVTLARRSLRVGDPVRGGTTPRHRGAPSR